MSAFLAVAAALIGVALVFVVLPLLRRAPATGESRTATNIAVYRDQLRELAADLQAGTLARDQYDRARRELEARLLADVEAPSANPGPAAAPARRSRAAAIALGVAVPLCAVAVYLTVGNPAALVGGGADREAAHGMNPQQFEALVARLAARLKDNPEDAEGWMMLGRSYAVLGRFKEASDAYAKAAVRAPADAQLLADYADALAMAQGRRLEGEPEKLIARALAADPENVKANMLAGTVAFNRGDYATAAGHWERILDGIPPESELAQQVRGAIADARAQGGNGATPSVPKSAGRASPAAAGRVRGVVKLAPGLASKAGPDDTVFIFARAAQGPRMPLAIVRKQVRDLPYEFTLDDSMAMSPAMKLSGQQRVVVGARISKSGNATPQAGDLEGMTAPIAVGADRVSVMIDREVP